MKRYLRTLISGIISGLLISIGGIVNLSCDNKYLGALLFSVGLFFIVEGGFKLYTGAIGYAIENKKEDNIGLIFILLGNFIGTLATASLIRITRVSENLITKAQALVDIKLNDTWYSVLILAILCGVLIYLGVNTFKKSNNNFSKVVGIIFCVIVFILSSYEHCIANMFYFCCAGSYSIKGLIYVIIMIIGNSIGGLLIPFLTLLFKEKKVCE